MSVSNHTGKRAKKKRFLDIATLIRSIQRAEGNIDCFQMGVVDCGEMDCKWRTICMEVYPFFDEDET